MCLGPCSTGIPLIIMYPMKTIAYLIQSNYCFRNMQKKNYHHFCIWKSLYITACNYLALSIFAFEIYCSCCFFFFKVNINYNASFNALIQQKSFIIFKSWLYRVFSFKVFNQVFEAFNATSLHKVIILYLIKKINCSGVPSSVVLTIYLYDAPLAF